MEAMTEQSQRGMQYESVLIGALLNLGRDAVKQVAEFLKPIHFGNQICREIYRSILSLYLDSITDITTITVSRQMRDAGTLKYTTESEIVGFTIENANVMPANLSAVRELGAMVAEDAIRILTFQLSQQMQLQTQDRTADIFDIITTARAKLDELGSTGRKNPVVPATSGLLDVLEHVEAMVKGEQKAWGIPTGFRMLDHYVYGFEPMNLYIIAGRPSHGKTAFMMDVARHQAHDHSICIFSMEMGLSELIIRMLSGESGVPYQSIKTGKFVGGEYEFMVQQANKLGSAVGNRLYVADCAGLTLSEIRLYTMMAKEMYGIRGIYIDYLQLINMDEKGINRDQAIGRTTRGLKQLAKELKIFVVVLSQLSRAVEIRTEKRPQLSDLRESGNIEQDADCVLFVWRPYIQGIKEFDHYGETIMDTKDKAVVIIGKQRNGELGESIFNFDGKRVRFTERSYAPMPAELPPPEAAQKELPSEPEGFIF